MLSVFKVLTFICASLLLSGNVFSSVLKQESKKSHLRWTISTIKKQVHIVKKGKTLTIETLDPEVFEHISNDIKRVAKDTKYHTEFRVTPQSRSGSPNKLEVILKDNSIELFSFYKNDDKKYILDFWINQDIANAKTLVKAPRKIKIASLKPKKSIKKLPKAPNLNKALRTPRKGAFNIIDPSNITAASSSAKYRDFRYGMAFVWDYKPVVPALEKDLNLSVKGPDYLYNIKDRTLLDDKKEAHLQLIINFYRKEKWGLMTKSISLYEQRYGRDSNHATTEFMKAISMIRNVIKNNTENTSEFSKKGLLAAARNILDGVLQSTQNYGLKQAILRYQIQYTRNEKDHIKSLSYAKTLYVASSEAFNDEMMIYSSRVILNSLAHLKQLEKISSFLDTKAVKRILPKQIGHAYIGFINLHNDRSKEVIKDYERNKKSFGKAVHSAILYNTAEAYFRDAQYKKAINLYDQFLSQYSFQNENSHARLRIALSYDLLGKKTEKVLQLYLDAINKSSIMNIRYEAKLRYVGLRVGRNKDLSQKDIETVAFLDASVAERKLLNKDNRKALWLTRLRVFVSEKKYEEALAYLSTLPLDGLSAMKRRVFLADGSEIVLGIIQQHYLNENYAKAVKTWEVYKNKYEKIVAKSPYMNFIVSDSFLKLGLYKSYDRSLKGLINIKDSKKRSYPRWVESQKELKVQEYITELQMSNFLRRRDYKGLEIFLKKNPRRKNVNYNFYNAIVSYKSKKYNKAVEEVEKLLTQPNKKNLLTPNQNQTMLETYLESLYEFAEPVRFRRNLAAMINDFRRIDNTGYKKLLERGEYLFLESLFSETKMSARLIAKRSQEFLSDQKGSKFSQRVKYIRAVSLIKNAELEEGKKLLESLVGSKEVPAYLKGLARTELSSLLLEEKTL